MTLTCAHANEHKGESSISLGTFASFVYMTIFIVMQGDDNGSKSRLVTLDECDFPITCINVGRCPAYMARR